MLKSKLMAICKSSRFVYSLYFFSLNFLISVLRIFVKSDDKLVLINSFGGKKYDDSPRAVYEKMIADERFKDYKFIWAFHNPNLFDIPNGEKIHTDCLKYYITALKARIWISNSGIERGLNFKGKNTFYYNSWHGTPIKIMGKDIAKSNKSFKSKSGNYKNVVDVYSAQSVYEADIMARAFEVPRSRYHITGLPRNDVLYAKKDEETRALKKRALGIPENKKVILFAPTFREYKKNSMGECITDWPIDFQNLHEKLGDEYVILLRAHYEAVKSSGIEENDFLKNVSLYPELNDLMIASDILVSDYSSMLFDYSILDRPMICFAYDYDEYFEKRGLYFDVREKLKDASEGEDALIKAVLQLNTEVGIRENINMVRKFRESYVEEYGSAAEQVVNIIYDNINEVKVIK